MKIKEAFDKVLKTAENEGCADIDAFSETLSLNIYIGWNEEFDSRVKGYYLWNWMCTDTVVGGTLYFFDDKPLAFGVQTARKDHETLEFTSKEVADELRTFIRSLVEDEEVAILNMEEDLGEGYRVRYAGQLMHNHKAGNVDGKPVSIAQREADPTDYICQQTVVQYAGGSAETVSTASIELPFNIG